MNDSEKPRGSEAMNFLYNLFGCKKRRSLFCCLERLQEPGIEVESFVDSLFQVNTFIPLAFKPHCHRVKAHDCTQHGYKVMPSSLKFRNLVRKAQI